MSAPTTKGPYEDKRNWAACFRNENKREPWMADYTGAVTLEDGQKFWVNLHEKKDRNGKTYFSVGLKPFQPKPQMEGGRP